MELKDITSCVSNTTTITSTASVPSSLETLHEAGDIRILPQHRLKVPQTNLIPAVCFYNGTFVPIHAGHLSVLQEAKQYIANLGTHELLAAYMSPSHSGYAAKKLRPEEVIGAGHRLAMTYLATESFDWVMVDLFEFFQPSNASLTVVMEAFISRVHSQLPNGARTDIFWLKGEDSLFHNKSPDKYIRLGFHTLYVLNRECNESIINKSDELTSVQNYYEKRWQDIRASSSFPERFHMVQATHMNLSSSTIRACARNPSITREQLQSCTQLYSITTYILQHHLWSAFANTLLTAMPFLPVFPSEITDLTPEILSYMLSASVSSSTKVISFMFEQIGVDKGWNGALYRLYDIQYSADTTDCLPQCMCTLDEEISSTTIDPQTFPSLSLPAGAHGTPFVIIPINLSPQARRHSVSSLSLLISPEASSGGACLSLSKSCTDNDAFLVLLGVLIGESPGSFTGKTKMNENIELKDFTETRRIALATEEAEDEKVLTTTAATPNSPKKSDPSSSSLLVNTVRFKIIRSSLLLVS
ncbi:unnamed protein product [Didymodactylos carnosus]|uniref:Cytidyltransferase-like domain-containing protein n=1 Tax=Didymodactylos carnosus TaxID=1234261 RepID=A0A8S2DU45_9BILA|nr:unnamed protein product [Didymodactylos carnosus]CAF3778560.1 unnamed protein product [Didymodactylos carnosus]